MSEQRFALPIVPPSVNSMFANVPGKGRVKSAEYRRWFEAARWTIAAHRPLLVTYDVVVDILCQRPTKTSDIDNRQKALLDALSGLAFKDDRQVVDLRIRWAPIEGVHITVREAR
jgi:crossover junction endodeoxyribonuclease RusA